MRKTLSCFVLAIAMAGCTGASARGRITQLGEISVRPGPNQVNMFVQDGRSGLITEGWRDLGGTVGYPVYTVMIPSTNPARGWDIVPVETGDKHETTEITGAARFARGWLDGTPTTFVFTAHRDSDSDMARPATMVVDAYRLVTSRKGDRSENAFVLVSSTKSSDKVCNPDTAIAREFGLEEGNERLRHGSCV
jgi:hypothetical protein